MRQFGLGLAHRAMTAAVHVLLADADANVLATLSVGVIAAIVWSSVQESRKARRNRRRLERKHRMPVEQLLGPVTVNPPHTDTLQR